MNIELGEVYKFNFITKFNSLTGIYRADSIIGYDSILENDVDLLETLYTPASLVEADLVTDLPDLAQENFVILISVIDDTIVRTIPMSAILGYPEPDVYEYSQLILNIDLGTFSDNDMLQSIASMVDTKIKGLLGVPAETSLMTYGSEWMSQSDYQTMQANRAQVIADNPGENVYIRLTQKEAELTAANAKVNALTALVKSLQSQISP